MDKEKPIIIDGKHHYQDSWGNDVNVDEGQLLFTVFRDMEVLESLADKLEVQKDYYRREIGRLNRISIIFLEWRDAIVKEAAKTRGSE